MAEPAAAIGDSPEPVILRAENLTMHYGSRKNRGLRKTSTTIAVEHVNLYLRTGETLAVVGESGCGKSTLARMLVGLETPTEGAVYLHGNLRTGLKPSELRPHWRAMQLVFQDPYASLHPRRRVDRIISEPWRVHRDLEATARWSERISELLDMVGLPEHTAHKFSSQLSGGERQRVALARALAMRPKILVLDEPTSSLDVSIQAQVVKLLMQLQERLNLSYVFISHDLALVKLVADRVMVMNAGRVVEEGETRAVYDSPQSDVTQRLLSDS